MSNRFEILYRARQYHCRAQCKILKWFHDWHGCYRVARFNTLRPRPNGRRFADDTFKRIFLNENVRISIKVSLNFVPKGPINNNPALVQIMAWCRLGDKPLSEPMLVSLLSHICVARPQWVKTVFGLISYIQQSVADSFWTEALQFGKYTSTPNLLKPVITAHTGTQPIISTNVVRSQYPWSCSTIWITLYRTQHCDCRH